MDWPVQQMELPVELLEHCFLFVFQSSNENWLIDFHAILMVRTLFVLLIEVRNAVFVVVVWVA